MALLAVQAAAVAVMALLLCDGFEGALLVLVALLLGLSAGRRLALPWIAAQSSLLAAAVAVHWSPRSALLLVPPYLGFQLLAFAVVGALAREAAARRSLGEALDELRAAQELLADGARTGERLRISHELHDAVGHHLVALGLHLEAAAHRPGGAEIDEVRTARSLVRLLLTDLGEIVGELEQGGGYDLRRALAALGDEVPRPRVHVDGGADLDLADPERARALLRCCQEIVTNAAKHAAADNLWLELARDDRAVTLSARDDGRGAVEPVEGRGLTGIRRRLEALGGEVRYETAPGAGFRVEARLPVAGG